MLDLLKRLKRRVLVQRSLFFEYEVNPHKAFVRKRAGLKPSNVSETEGSKEDKRGANSQGLEDQIGTIMPFKQNRLQGQPNPLRPPIHVETVLIGKALGQRTGYFHGVGFRVRDDGFVEAEFPSGVLKFESYDEFSTAVLGRVTKPGL
jgi:hypothetical protein